MRILFIIGSMITLAGGCDDSVAAPASLSIDRSLLEPSPDQFQDLSSCAPREFDLTGAIDDDDDVVSIAWLVDYAPGSGSAPDAIDRLSFTFDPCTNIKAQDGKVSTIEAFVVDRDMPIATKADADAFKAFAVGDVTSDYVVWFVGFDDCESSCRR